MKVDKKLTHKLLHLGYILAENKAFTLTGRSILKDLKTECGVTAGSPPINGIVSNDGLVKFIGLWDTGASLSAISHNVVNALGLKPIGQCIVQHANGSHNANVYLVNIFLPNNHAICMISATCGQLPPGLDLLIGMDVITTGDFSITNKGSKTIFTFRIPSIRIVDFVKHNARPWYKRLLRISHQ